MKEIDCERERERERERRDSALQWWEGVEMIPVVA